MGTETMTKAMARSIRVDIGDINENNEYVDQG
jgi:hypothetical protein